MTALHYHGDGTGYPYLAGEGLAKVVNVALVLGRPLLVKGPPGCGKTRLAESVARELDLPLFEWYVKSTSQARDGLYSIDVLRRLQDAQMQDRKAQTLVPYIRFGELGKSFRCPGRSVLLIDEIDKADIDFPNDLLRELDQKAFTIEELDAAQLTDEDRANGWAKTYHAVATPLIVITSNDEKELPDAFLRRCLFHYIEFPSAERLCDIVRVNLQGLDVSARLVELAVRRMGELRQVSAVRKPPATSELIDWVRILHHWSIDTTVLENAARLTDLPGWEMLFKHQQDLQAVQRQAQGEVAE